jgi:hypothetical protein
MRKAERQQLQDMVLQWVLLWAVIGLALGILQLLRTGAVSWIFSLTLGGGAGGLGTGILYAGLMLLTENWRDSLADTPGLPAQVGPQVACGVGAGILPGLLVGGLSGALFFGGLGALTSAVLNWRSVREGMRPRVAARKPISAKGPTKR